MAHNHPQSTRSYGKAFALGVGLNILFVAVEIFYGVSVNSSALLADAGHNASDVLSLLLAWGAIVIAKKKPSGKYTYGLRKTTILASLANGILIVGAAGVITWEAIHKIKDPSGVPGNVIMIVAGIGVIINTLTALLFMKGQKEDLNIKGAFLHMAADAGVSAGVVLGGFLIRETGNNLIDPILSFLIVLVILYSAWGLLRDSLNLALDAVPADINLAEVRIFLERIKGVKEVHDLHVWALSTTQTALTAHLVVPEGHDDHFLFSVRDQLKKEFNIDHSTIQVEKTFSEKESGNC